MKRIEADDERLKRRALAAWFRSGGSDTPAVGGHVVEHDGRLYVVLSNVHGTLGVYRVRNDGVLRRMKRWPEKVTALPAVSTRYDRWMGRVFRGALDFWGENWQDLSGTAQYADWQKLVQSRGGAADAQYYMTRGLLSEVLYAAGGVERELGHLTTALADVQRAADDALSQQTVSAANWPVHGHHITTTSMREASYIFINLLAWARSMRERTDRRYKPGSSERAGLLPALAAGLMHDTVQDALTALDTALAESRLLTNYALHAGAVPGGGTPSAEILRDGRILARIPDPSSGWILTWDEFKFTQNRDMLSYGNQLMAAIETFVDAVLDAFEANRPARAGPLPRIE
jgi:hypothetical protein